MEQSENTKSAELLLKYSSFAYILLVIAGLAFNYFYYKQFGINITSYIDFTEALLLFLPMMAEVLLIPLVYLLLLHYLIFKAMSRLDDNNEGSTFFSSKKVMVSTVNGMFFLIATGTVLALIMSILNIWSPDVPYLFIACLICFFGPYYIEMFLKTINYSISPVFKYAFYSLIITLCLVTVRAGSKAARFRSKRDFQFFELIHRDSTLSFGNDSTVQMLGRTRNYIFLYDFKNKKSIVYAVSDIKRFSVWEEGASKNLSRKPADITPQNRPDTMRHIAPQVDTALKTVPSAK